VHQLVIKRFQHCLMHGVTMKFILNRVYRKNMKHIFYVKQAYIVFSFYSLFSRQL